MRKRPFWALCAAVALTVVPAPGRSDPQTTRRAFIPTPLSEPRYRVLAPRDDPDRQSHLVTAHDGVHLFVETWLPGEAADGQAPPETVPTVLVVTPYRARGQAAYPDLIAHLVPRGYAVAQHHVRGTGESGGCLEQTGPNQIDDAARVIEYLGRDAPWSNGAVGMYGISYDAETQISVAGLGDPARTSYLKAIIPVASVGGQYEYSNFDGVPYTGWGLTSNLLYVNTSMFNRPASPANYPRMLQRPGCQPEVLSESASLSGDMTPFWSAREYRPGAPSIRAATLMVHGHADWNVRPITAAGFFDRIPATTPHKGVFGVWAHNFPSVNSVRPAWSRADWPAMVTAWFDRYLLGLSTGVESWPAVQVQATDGTWRAEPSWPTTGGPVGHLALGPGGTLGATAPAGESAYRETSIATDVDDAGAASFETAPMPARLHLTGQPVLDLWVILEQPDAHVTARLRVIDAGGEVVDVGLNYGFRSARHLEPLVNNTFAQAAGTDPPIGVPLRVQVRMFPGDVVVPAGGRLRLEIAGGLQSGTTRLSAPAASVGRVRILHDCEHPSALRFLLARPDPDLLNVWLQGEDLPVDDTTAIPVADGGGIATASVCGSAPERLDTFGPAIPYAPPG